jgi:uncharacterized phiE125 gp8 family phage protein
MIFVQIETVTAPTALPVTADEFADHARLNGLTVDLQPDLIDRELRAATARAEQFCRRSLLTQTLAGLYVPEDSPCNGTSSSVLILPRGKVQKVNSITTAGDVVDPLTYALDWNVVTLDVPLAAATAIEFVSGYGDDPDDVPAGIKDGILEYATVLYERRSGERDQKFAPKFPGQGVPDGVRDLWRPYQIEISG